MREHGNLAGVSGHIERVLGVLAGADFPLDRLAEWARTADVILAADGAADRLLQAGIEPTTTIGDLDSLSSVLGLKRVIQDPDQETSDCDKLLNLANRIGHRAITLAGVEGDRLDHVLSTFASAAKCGLAVRLVLRDGIAHVLRGPGVYLFDAIPGERVSLMPLERCEDLHLSGVAWPLEGGVLSALGQVSISNQVSAARIEVRLASGAAVLFLAGAERATPSW